MLVDRYGRPVLNLRIAVTNRCNYKCEFCHREGEIQPHTEMSKDEIITLVRAAANLGIKRVKITGGEPLLRNDIVDIIGEISEINGIEEVSMTTNASLLENLAAELKEAGLSRVNISMHSIKEDTYRKITGGGDLKKAIRGIHAALQAGLSPIKLNMVLLRNINDGEVYGAIEFSRKIGAILQLIELEPVNIPLSYYYDRHISLDNVESYLKEIAHGFKVRERMQNRRIYYLDGTSVELVRPINNRAFCAKCTRLRITSDGKIKPCLMRTDNLVDALSYLRRGGDENELRSLFLEAVARREPFYK